MNHPVFLLSVSRFLAGLSFAAALSAHEVIAPAGWKAKLHPDVHVHAPSPLPDRIVLTWNGDPATTQAVTWRTDATAMRGMAELAPAHDNGRAMNPARPRKAT